MNTRCRISASTSRRWQRVALSAIVSVFTLSASSAYSLTMTVDANGAKISPLETDTSLLSSSTEPMLDCAVLAGQYRDTQDRFDLVIDDEGYMVGEGIVRYGNRDYVVTNHGPLQWNPSLRACAARGSFDNYTYRCRHNVTTYVRQSAQGQIVLGRIQPTVIDANCREYGQTHLTWDLRPVADTPTGSEALLGALAYNGGFSNRLQIDVPEDAFITHIRIVVPAFCRGLEILAVETTYSGQIEQASLLQAGNQLYAVNGGHGRHASSVLVTMNGPRELSCDLPIYATFLGQ